MRASGWTGGVVLTLLAVVFSVGLTFASVELPALLHGALVSMLPALEGDSDADDAALTRTEMFLRHYHLRTLGYLCFGLMVVLIVLGFALGRKGPAVTGALLMLLPVFAQLAAVMFFLAGLVVLNLVWLPVLDISFEAGHLGEIVYLPYRLVHTPFLQLGVDIHRPIVFLLIGGGLLLFTLGTLAWFLARFQGRDVAGLWVHRISRHPQYLGWIIWSYGMQLALMRVSYPERSWGIGASLPWLLSTMIIIGVALLEAGAAAGPLITMLDDPSGPVRYAAAVALGRIGARQSVTPLIAALDDSGPWNRAAAVYALGQLGDSRAADVLQAALDDADAETRLFAEEALEVIEQDAARK